MGAVPFIQCSSDLEDGILIEPISFCTCNFDFIDFTCPFNATFVSPSAAMCVLWHALSADTNVIREYMWAFHDSNGFEFDLLHWPDFLKPHGLNPANTYDFNKLQRIQARIKLWSNATTWDWDEDVSTNDEASDDNNNSIEIGETNEANNTSIEMGEPPEE